MLVIVPAISPIIQLTKETTFCSKKLVPETDQTEATDDNNKTGIL